ncbi:ectoine hydroxylase [Thalassospiraceae bacterium SW-3-3]|nr:ectoine hydroxylase [Thalassospiraceae bacterium SW-3-3]
MLTDMYRSRHCSRPTIIDRVDPVIWSDHGHCPMISAEDEKFYEKNGFLFLKNVFSEKEVAELRREADRVENSDPTDDEVVSEPGSNEVRSVFRVHDKSDVFAHLISDDRLVTIAEHFLDDDVYIHQSRVNFKPAFKGKEFFWHSDFETWHTEDGMPRMRAFSMSITLTDNSAHNGPLMLIPGSHKQFISCVGETPDQNYKSSLKIQEVGTPDQDNLSQMVDENGIVAPVGPAGSVLIFDCNTLHGSGNNITPYPRSNLFFVYNAMSNRLVAPFGGTKPRPNFLATRENIVPVHTDRHKIQAAE